MLLYTTRLATCCPSTILRLRSTKILPLQLNTTGVDFVRLNAAARSV